MGGKVEYLMLMLEAMKYEILNELDEGAVFCDMVILNKLLHFYWNTDTVFTGPPLHTRFLLLEHDQYISHK